MSPTAPLRHLLVADATCPPSPGPANGGPSGTAHAASAALAPLAALLPRLRETSRIDCPSDSPATAHELALARALGLPGAPGRQPWAAFESGITGQPCAWLLPAHLQLGMDSASLTDPAAMQLADADSQALLAAAAPLLAGDGLTLAQASGRPGCWLSQGGLWQHVLAPSPAAAQRQQLSREALARADDPAHQRQLTRLLSELEMLLASHPVNHAREAAGLPPVNTLWVHGAGLLAQPLPPAVGVAVIGGWAQPEAASQLAALLAAAQAGQPVQLTLSGPQRTITLGNAGMGAGQRLLRRIATGLGRRPLDVLQQL